MSPSVPKASSAPPGDGVPPEWIFYPALLVILLFFSENLRYSSPLLICGLIVVVALPALLGIGFRAAGHRIPSSVCGVIVVSFYWLPFCLLLLLILSRSATLGYGMIIGLYLAIVALPLWIFGLFAAFAMARHVGPNWALSAVLLALLPSIILIGVGEADRAKRDRARFGPRPSDPIVMKDDFLKLNACLQGFTKSNAVKGFPDSLSELGPQGNGCLSEELVKGLRGNFTIHYQPGTQSSSGSVETYSIAALETVPNAPHQSSRMYSDQSGMIWLRYDGPQAQGRPYLLYYPGMQFNTAEDCAWEAAGTSWNVYENDRTKTVTDRDTFLKSCTQSLGDFGFEYGYTFTERPDGTAASFQLHVRPKTYGITALRSYVALGTFTEDGKPRRLTVYATPQDRPATEQDALALPQEVSMPAELQVADEQWCGGQLCE